MYNPTLSRRNLLRGSAAAALMTTLPMSFSALASAATPLRPTDRMLVTIFLNGGNDALNTLIPEGGLYVDRRGGLAIERSDATSIGDGHHLNPNLARLRDRYLAGEVALIPGIGEPPDDHSHFTGTATWMSAEPPGPGRSGWIGRFMDDVRVGPLSSVSMGWTGVPLLMRGRTHQAVGLPSWGPLFGADRSEPFRRLPLEALSTLDPGDYPPLLGSWADVAATGVDTAVDVDPVFDVDGPIEGLPRRMALAAALLDIDLGTRCISVMHDGYDTHDNQAPRHTELLSELDEALDVFFTTLSPANAARTAVLVISEFGRRVAPSASLGTDHGAAGLAMFMGPSVRGGIRSTPSSLSTLDARGDQHHTVDFRSVYATVIRDWLGGDDHDVLGATHERLDLVDEPAPGAFPPASSRFTDVPDGQWYSDAIAWMAATGITTGTSPTTFSPHDPLTRGQTAAFLHRFRGEPTGAPPAGFEDVERGRYYAVPIDWMASTGITTGTSPTRFSPGDPLTRAHLATFLWRMEGRPARPAAAFTDVERPSYYASAVDWMAADGITTGTSPTTFSPHETVTRAQFATLLWRLAGEPSST